jgi:hypothetical protein
LFALYDVFLAHASTDIPLPTISSFSAGILEQYNMGARHRVGIGLSYRPDRLHWLAESIPRLLKSLKIPSPGCGSHQNGAICMDTLEPSFLPPTVYTASSSKASKIKMQSVHISLFTNVESYLLFMLNHCRQKSKFPAGQQHDTDVNSRL